MNHILIAAIASLIFAGDGQAASSYVTCEDFDACGGARDAGGVFGLVALVVALVALSLLIGLRGWVMLFLVHAIPFLVLFGAPTLFAYVAGRVFGVNSAEQTIALLGGFFVSWKVFALMDRRVGPPSHGPNKGYKPPPLADINPDDLEIRVRVVRKATATSVTTPIKQAVEPSVSSSSNCPTGPAVLNEADYSLLAERLNDVPEGAGFVVIGGASGIRHIVIEGPKLQRKCKRFLAWLRLHAGNDPNWREFFAHGWSQPDVKRIVETEDASEQARACADKLNRQLPQCCRIWHWGLWED